MYRTDVYFLAKTLAELPFFMVLPLLFVSICYYMIDFGGTFYNFVVCAGVIMLVANTSTSFGASLTQIDLMVYTTLCRIGFI